MDTGTNVHHAVSRDIFVIRNMVKMHFAFFASIEICCINAPDTSLWIVETTGQLYAEWNAQSWLAVDFFFRPPCILHNNNKMHTPPLIIIIVSFAVFAVFFPLLLTIFLLQSYNFCFVVVSLGFFPSFSG